MVRTPCSTRSLGTRRPIDKRYLCPMAAATGGFDAFSPRARVPRSGSPTYWSFRTRSNQVLR
jgi:hypothetical protein